MELDISDVSNQYYVARSTIQKYWELWWNRAHPVKLKNLPPLVCSGIWLGRNNKKN